MLEITIMPNEHFDDRTNKVFWLPKEPVVLNLEHSLLSISKWEAKWHKSFLNNPEMTDEEVLDYIHCMCVKPTQEQVSKALILEMSPENVDAIKNYIEDPMTATFFSEKTGKAGKGAHNKRIVTNELIYYWMSAYQIPFSCEKWHISRLLTLIRVCNEETEAANNPDGKKVSNSELYARNRALNAQRRAKLHSKG